jgi:hypothetical protein
MFVKSETPTARIEQEPEHDLVLQVAGLVDGVVELLQIVVGQSPGEAPGARWPANLHLLPALAVHATEALIVEPGEADQDLAPLINIRCKIRRQGRLPFAPLSFRVVKKTSVER